MEKDQIIHSGHDSVINSKTNVDVMVMAAAAYYLASIITFLLHDGMISNSIFIFRIWNTVTSWSDDVMSVKKFLIITFHI